MLKWPDFIYRFRRSDVQNRHGIVRKWYGKRETAAVPSGIKSVGIHSAPPLYCGTEQRKTLCLTSPPKNCTLHSFVYCLINRPIHGPSFQPQPSRTPANNTYVQTDFFLILRCTIGGSYRIDETDQHKFPLQRRLSGSVRFTRRTDVVSIKPTDTWF